MDYVCTTYNYARHMAYTQGFPYLDYPIDVLVSCD